MIQGGAKRTSINKHVPRIKLAFRWAVENELLVPSVYQALQAVRGLAKGRTEAVESKPVKPVPLEAVEAIRPHVSRQIWAMIRDPAFDRGPTWRGGLDAHRRLEHVRVDLAAESPMGYFASRKAPNRGRPIAHQSGHGRVKPNSQLLAGALNCPAGAFALLRKLPERSPVVCSAGLMPYWRASDD